MTANDPNFLHLSKALYHLHLARGCVDATEAYQPLNTAIQVALAQCLGEVGKLLKPSRPIYLVPKPVP